MLGYYLHYYTCIYTIVILHIYFSIVFLLDLSPITPALLPRIMPSTSLSPSGSYRISPSLFNFPNALIASIPAEANTSLSTLGAASQSKYIKCVTYFFHNPFLTILSRGGDDNDVLCSPALTIAFTKSTAVNGWLEGPVSRSILPFRIRILNLMLGEQVIAAPTPLSINDGTMDVNKEPILYITADEDVKALMTRGLASWEIGAPYGEM